jgi:hypothetical protein
MKELCGKCWKSPCQCVELTTRHPLEWAIGERLDDLAESVDLQRGASEPDDTLRSRLQLTVINGSPWRSGISGGRLLDRLANRHSVHRSYNEPDSRLLERLLMTVAKSRMPNSTPREAIAFALDPIQKTHGKNPQVLA